ncbi:Alpha/Beta hydrolase protein [Pyronema omphalodes]|nr:Alpha/Beta hydrolase protein [Pyronema omphalodes]
MLYYMLLFELIGVLGVLGVLPAIAGEVIPDTSGTINIPGISTNPEFKFPRQSFSSINTADTDTADTDTADTDTADTDTASAATTPSFTPHTRQYFYIPGAYTLTTHGAHTHQHQLYTEHLIPLHANPQHPYILLLHGAAQTGTNWLNTPDGRPGWADHFLSHHYRVIIPDTSHRGRSPYPPGSSMVAYSAELIEERFTAPDKKKLWPFTGLHTQWPGSGVMGDTIFDAYYRSTVPLEGNNTLQQEWMREGLVGLVQRLIEEDQKAEVVIVGHSQAGAFGWLLADDHRVGGRIKGYVAIEPSGPPFQNEVFETGKARKWGLADVEMRWDPPGSGFDLIRVGRETRERTGCWLQDPKKGRVKQLVGLRDIPMMVVTSESGYHRVYDHCTVEFLKQAGVKKVKFAELWKMGIRGGGHMMMMEKNSYDVWKVIEKWIREL